eukprot:TRINITY_DN4708_c0_g1_i5.p1 TRINITY_DN4708_c0_g1~~TRINITY_DN4708_c0_g1_i5.p1  ORF type:complete len:148 (-),score=35.30 TRINITY_DN4708_c0_g1_i5:174-617(-)
MLELKVRLWVKEDKTEKWKKVVTCKAKDPLSRTDEWPTDLHPKIKTAKEILANPEIFNYQRDIFEIRKKRVQFFCQGWTCEQVRLSVLNQGTHLGDFISINFEGSRNLVEIQKSVVGDLLDNDKVLVMGYPEFVSYLAASHFSQTRP